MDNFEKIIIGVVLFAVTSTIAYLFRMRQLYVVVPKLFRHAQISKSGSLCELLVYNKGNQVEEDVQVSLDPELKGELLASSSNDVSLIGSTVKIERLHKGTEASAVLLIENGVLDSTKIISASSKGAKGRVLKKATDIPPNFAKAFLIFIGYVALFPSVYYGEKGYREFKSNRVKSDLQATYNIGWKNLDRYYDSELRKSYSDLEFPIRFLRNASGRDKKPVLEFEVYNKTALPFDVSVNNSAATAGDISNFASMGVAPMSKALLSVPRPKNASDGDTPELRFAIKAGDELVFGLRYSVTP